MDMVVDRPCGRGPGGGIEGEEEEGEEVKDRDEQDSSREDDGRGRRCRREEADILEERRERVGFWESADGWRGGKDRKEERREVGICPGGRDPPPPSTSATLQPPPSSTRERTRHHNP